MQINEEELVNQIKGFVSENLELSSMSDEQLEEKIDQIVSDRLKDTYCPIEKKISIAGQVYSSIRGFGLLDSIISDDTITEVMINGPDNIFIEKNGRLSKLDKRFDSTRRLEDIIQRIVGLAGREVNQANPICDTRLPDGSRVNVVLPPIALCGPTITIRKFSKEPMTIEKLIRYGSITQEIADKLELLVKAKYNIFICGGTGSGKTTFLNALSNYIPSDERVITIEDSAELQITGVDNLVSLETRNANAAGAGQITIRDLIKSSLRMRPERIVVGEVRGGEALGMPEIIGNMLLYFYTEDVKECDKLVDMLGDRDPLGYGDAMMYTYKFKKFLCSCALGMKPAKPWDGLDEANGGYIIVKADGEILAYHIYNRNFFEQYLLDNTILERASTSRHDYMSLYEENGEMFIKLNLQIRFR